VDTVGKNASKIAEYIRNQLKEDEAAVQLSIDFEGDPFTGQAKYQASVGPFPQPRHAAAGARGLKSPNMKNHQLGWWVSFIGQIA
jgi:hypothetical protein